MLPHVPEDPYLLYNTQVQSGQQHGENRLADAGRAVDEIVRLGSART